MNKLKTKDNNKKHVTLKEFLQYIAFGIPFLGGLYLIEHNAFFKQLIESYPKWEKLIYGIFIFGGIFVIAIMFALIDLLWGLITRRYKCPRCKQKFAPVGLGNKDSVISCAYCGYQTTVEKMYGKDIADILKEDNENQISKSENDK